MNRLKGNIAIENIKRCYVKDCIAVLRCTCGHMIRIDMSDQYLSYPIIGREDTLGFYCEKCDAEYNKRLVVKSAVITMEVEEATQEG